MIINNTKGKDHYMQNRNTKRGRSSQPIRKQISEQNSRKVSGSRRPPHNPPKSGSSKGK